MKGDLIGPFAMHVCAPFWPSPWRQWPYCLKHAGARDSPTGLLSQMTVQVSEVQPFLTHQVQDWPGTCHWHFHALDTWSLLRLWVYDHRYHSLLNRNHPSSLSCSQEQGSHPHKPRSERVSFTGQKEGLLQHEAWIWKHFPWQWHHHGEQSQKADLQLVTLSQDLKCASFKAAFTLFLGYLFLRTCCAFFCTVSEWGLKMTMD